MPGKTDHRKIPKPISRAVLQQQITKPKTASASTPGTARHPGSKRQAFINTSISLQITTPNASDPHLATRR